MNFVPENPDYERDVRSIAVAQPFMTLIGGTIERVAPGEVELRLPFRDDLAQHSGVLHAGVTTTLADNACGCAAATLPPKGSLPLTTEFKINLVAPAVGEAIVARGRVVSAGKRMQTCAADVFAQQGGEERLVATMLASMFRAESSP